MPRCCGRGRAAGDCRPQEAPVVGSRAPARPGHSWARSRRVDVWQQRRQVGTMPRGPRKQLGVRATHLALQICWRACSRTAQGTSRQHARALPCGGAAGRLCCVRATLACRCCTARVPTAGLPRAGSRPAPSTWTTTTAWRSYRWQTCSTTRWPTLPPCSACAPPHPHPLTLAHTHAISTPSSSTRAAGRLMPPNTAPQIRYEPYEL